MSRVRLCAIALLVLVGCVRGGCSRDADSAQVARATQDWLAGRLPASVSAGTPKHGGTLVLRVPSEPNGLNRLHDAQRDGYMVRYTMGVVLETLFELDRDTHPRYELKPLLALGYTESTDHLTHTFSLRRGVKFHDGQPFTARDVIAVLDAVMNPKNLTVQARSAFVNLKDYSALDEHTVVVRWKSPDYLGFRALVASIPLFPASALKGDFNTAPINRAPVGTGPFKFERWDEGRQLSFVRNRAYWGEQPYLDRIVVRMVKDDTVATQMFERGEFDVMTKIVPSVWRALEQPDPRNAWAVRGYHRILSPQNNYSYIAWNAERPYFRDARVRRALGMLYPYEQIAKNIEMGLEERTTCPFYKGSQNCDPEVEAHPLQYDPKRAAALLQEAGWRDVNGDGVLEKDGIPFRFTFLVTAQSVKVARVAPMLQAEFRKVGVELDIEKVDWAVYMQRLLRHDFDMAILIWSTADAEQDQYQVFHSSQTEGSNYVSYKNAEVDQLTLESRGEFDSQKRAALNRRLHRLVYEDQPYTFLTSRPDLDAVKTDVRGLRPALNFYDLRKVWLDR